MAVPRRKLTLADYYIEHKRPQDALPILTKLSAVKEAHAAAQARLAGIDYIQDRRSDAYAKVDALLKTDPKNVQVQVLKARWLLLEKRNDEALAAARRRSRPIRSQPTRSSSSAWSGGSQRGEPRRSRPSRSADAQSSCGAGAAELARINTAMGKGPRPSSSRPRW